MKPTKFEQCNRHLDFPNGESLDFFQDELTNKVIMLWQFDDEERARIAETGQLYISQVLGQTAVPMLDVPFREITDDEKAAIELQRKKAIAEAVATSKKIKVMEGKIARNKPNAKRVKLKAVK